LTLRIGAASLLSATLVLLLHATAQTSSAGRLRSLLDKSPVDRLVDQLIENAAAFRATLPSITAHETIESGGSYSWLFGRHAKAEATMRVMRKTPGGPLEESRQIMTVNGRPVAPGKHADLPTLLDGGFGGFGGAFFTAAVRHCFDYSLAPNNSEETLQLSIKMKPDAASLGNCPVGFERMSAMALVDAQAHQLTHIEWAIPEEDATPFHRWPFASTDFAPIKIGDETFWLPTTVTGHFVKGKERMDWVSHYSDYHRFTATANILPAAP
jgi:hypothetical protein